MHDPDLTRSRPQNILYVTVNLPDIKPESVKFDLKPTSLHFAAQAGTYVNYNHGGKLSCSRDARYRSEVKDYEFDLEFFEEIDPEVS